MRFIGFYDYTVILTYISLISSILGMVKSIHGDYKIAIFCLALSGVCDAFDGRVARTKKNRTDDEKTFGIQLDSLCDVICFGIFPAMLCYLMGVRGWLGIVIACFYCLCAVIRLAFFNVLEQNRQKSEGGCNKTYRGLPVTSISFILPLVFLFQVLIPERAFMIMLHIVLALVGFLFILDFKLPKPSLKVLLCMIGFVAICVGIVIVYTRFRMPHPYDESNPIVDELIGEEYEEAIP